MKKILYIILAAMAVLFVSCKPTINPEEPSEQEKPVVDPIPDPVPDPEPDEPSFKDNVIYFLDNGGQVTREIEVKSATSFVYNGGYYSFYLGTMDGLSPELVSSEDFTIGEGESIMAAAILNSFNGTKVLIGAEKLRYVFQSQIDGLDVLEANENTMSESITDGWFVMTIDKEALKATFELELNLSDGSKIKTKTVTDYIPGGENDNFVLLGDDYMRPLRVGFYDQPAASGFEPTLYIAVGEIEYGEDLTKTTYVGIAAASELCDGEPHNIEDFVRKKKLAIMFYSIEGYTLWDITDGQIIISKKADLDYEVVISAGHASDEYDDIYGETFEMYWSGSFADVNISRPVISQVEYNGNATPLQSAVIDVTGSVGYVYLCPSEGITTVEAAKADSPVVVTVSAEKVFSNVGLSTDKDNFSISYDGKTWDKETIDTCSYIVHDHSDDSIHCQVANFYLKTGKTKLKLEYKGPLTVVE